MYYNFTVDHGIINFEYKYIDESSGSDIEKVQLGEVLVDYLKNKIYLVYTSPYLPIEEYNWIQTNSTKFIGFSFCNECGFYGSQDSGSE
jgi:hypothetical protein